MQNKTKYHLLVSLLSVGGEEDSHPLGHSTVHPTTEACPW